MFIFSLIWMCCPCKFVVKFFWIWWMIGNYLWILQIGTRICISCFSMFQDCREKQSWDSGTALLVSILVNILFQFSSPVLFFNFLTYSSYELNNVIGCFEVWTSHMLVINYIGQLITIKNLPVVRVEVL